MMDPAGRPAGTIAALCVCAALLAWAGCGHDADRANPLDAKLTPPVSLTASQDSAGLVTLAWSRYAGDQPFADYLVLRNVARSIDVDTLATVDDIATTAFVDSTLAPATAYEYRVAVRNRHGLARPSDSQRVEGFVTRAVALQRPLADPATGTVRLVWSAYRDPGFERYEVFRRASGTDADSLLGLGSNTGDTTFVDTTALHGMNYVYRAVVVAAGLELTSAPVEGRLDLPSVLIDTLSMHAATATSDLVWTAYEGPRFASYDIWRSVGDERSLIASVPDRGTTRWQDTGLRGGVEYAYEAEVATIRAERIGGPARVGSFHGLVGQWPLELDGDVLADREFVRLYARGDSITALVTAASPQTSRLEIWRVVYAPDGRQLNAVRLVGVSSDAIEYDSRSSALAQYGDRLLLATAGNSGLTPGLLALADDGSMEGHALTIGIEFDRAVPAEPTTTLAIGGGDNGVFIYGNIAAFSGGDRAWGSAGYREVRLGESQSLYKGDGNWLDVAVEMDSYILNGGGKFHLNQGFVFLGETASTGLALSMAGTSMSLAWIVEADTITSASASWPAYVNIDRRHIRISQTATGFQTTISGGAIWSEDIDAIETWSSIASNGDYSVFTIGNRAYLLDDDTTVQRLSTGFEADVSETRTWSVDGVRSGFVGVCLPDISQVQYGPVFRESDWGRLISNSKIGPSLGNQDAGTLFYPLSLDGSRDGRVYVLDAGNSRIVVLDQDGNYITQFGRHGDGPWEFDFLDGRRIGLVSRGYAGSIAVDDDGFIYVADVGNGRIQKFAP